MLILLKDYVQGAHVYGNLSYLIGNSKDRCEVLVFEANRDNPFYFTFNDCSVCVDACMHTICVSVHACMYACGE